MKDKTEEEEEKTIEAIENETENAEIEQIEEAKLAQKEEDIFDTIHNFKEKVKQSEEISYSIEQETQNTFKAEKIKPAKLSSEAEEVETPEEDEEATKEDETPRGGSPTSSAKAFVMALNVLNSRLCGYIGKKPHTRYSLTPAEKKEVLELTIEYFEAENISMSPLFVFIFVISVTVGGKIGTAIEDRTEEKNKEIERAKAESKAKKVKAAGVEELKKQILEDGKQERFLEKFNDRSKFAFYPSGKYKNIYMYGSTGTGKRYALKQNEHLKDDNYELSNFVRNSYDKLKLHYANDKELFKILGVLIRQIQQQAEESI